MNKTIYRFCSKITGVATKYRFLFHFKNCTWSSVASGCSEQSSPIYDTFLSGKAFAEHHSLRSRELLMLSDGKSVLYKTPLTSEAMQWSL
jgi:hypothetical protein